MHVGYLAVDPPILSAAARPVAAISATATPHNTGIDQLSQLVAKAAAKVRQALHTAIG